MTAAEAPASADSVRSTPDGKPAQDRTPWLLGFLCFLMLALPTYLVVPGPLKGNGGPARIISVAMFGLVLLGLLLVRRTSRARRINPGLVILLVYFLLWLIAYGTGLHAFDNSFVAAGRTRGLITLISHVGVGLYVLTTVKTPRQRKIILGCLAAGLAFTCLVGLFQAFSSVDLRFVFKPPGFIINGEDFPLQERLGARRVLGTSQQPIEFSVLAAAAVPLTLYLARRSETRNARFLSAVACVLALLAIPAAVSRTGLISLSAGLLIYMLYFRVRQIAVTAAALSVAIGGYALAFPNIATAMWNTVAGSLDDTSIQERTDRYVRVSQIFHDHPVVGLGLGVQYLFDNEWLQAIVQGGLVGVLAMILFSGGTFFGISAALRCATTSIEREEAYVLGAVAVGILVSSTAFDLFYYQQATLILFIVFGLLWAPFTIAFTIDVPESYDSTATAIPSPAELALGLTKDCRT